MAICCLLCVFIFKMIAGSEDTVTTSRGLVMREDISSGGEILSCSFEKKCSFIDIVKLSEYNWIYGYGSTSTRNTGPLTDTTAGEHQRGRYLYAEASDGDPDDKAVFKLIPPVSLDGSQYCLGFWYHMYGRHIGNLHVFYSTERFNLSILNKTGQQDDNQRKWMKRQRQIPGLNGNFTVIFEATRGDGDDGDIAIDGLSLTRGHCQGVWGPWRSWSTCSETCGPGVRRRSRACIETPCQPRVWPGYHDARGCDLRPCYGEWAPWSLWLCTVTCGNGVEIRKRNCTGNSCEGDNREERPCIRNLCPVYECNFDLSPCLLQSKKDDFDWTRNRGSTQSTGTGPEADHTTGLGYYMFVEASVPRVENDTATLVSPRLLVKGRETCLDFWYHMHGADIGELKVSALYEDNTVGILILSGNKGDQWIEEKSTLLERIVEVEFTATLGDDFLGDIAIDDVIITEGRCSGQTVLQQWQGWSLCSRSCGGGTRKRIRGCDSPPCAGPSKEQQSCNIDPCQSWSQWGSWSQCPVSCGRARQVRRRECSIAGACVQDSPSEERECGTTSCPFWTIWGAWGVCTQTCGAGNKYRRRVCQNGPGCPGSPEDTLVCNTNECPRWTTWGPWSPCTKTCNSGTRTRSRSCEYAPNCPGGDRQSENCNIQSCIIGLTDWEEWSACNPTCGYGTKQRRRTCSGNNCQGNNMYETKECYAAHCQGSALSGWEEWSACNPTCGYGTKQRRRTCSGNSCQGVATVETKECYAAHCDGLTDWEEWSACNPTCGYGTKQRRRTCSGNNCQGNNMYETKECYAAHCQGSALSGWEEWSACNPTCGYGTKQRRRTCSGNSCQGVATVETKECYAAHCDGLTEWEEWSACNPTCGYGTKQRRRTCSGNNCQGNNMYETKECYAAHCQGSGLSGWEEWSACNPTCGYGTKQRRRTCSGNSCQGVATVETKECYAAHCDGSSSVWSVWKAWGACSASCDVGSKTRVRTCFRGTCNGASTDRTACMERQCSAVGIWNSWGSWSECSTSCGLGTRRRFRSCSRDPCSGTGSQTVVCDSSNNQGCVQQTNSWEEWGPWGTCSKTCGSGLRSRKRKCSTVNCVGPGEQFEQCPDRTCG